MSRRQTSLRLEPVVKKSDGVVVAVKACKDIPRAALTWALSNVVRTGDCVRLLVLIPTHHSGLWHFPHFHFHNDCTAGHWRLMSGTTSEQKEYITEQCNQLMSQLHDIFDPEKVMVKVQVVFDSTHGSVAIEAKRAQTHWVVLDKHLKKEAQICAEQLDCNVVVVKNSEPKILRLNLIEPRNSETEAHLFPKLAAKPDKHCFPTTLKSTKVPNVTPTTSPDWPASLSSLDSFTSTTFMAEPNWEPRVLTRASNPSYSSRESDYDQTDSDFSSSQIRSSRSTSVSYSSPDSRHSLRQIMSLRKGGAHDPPPLCSMCHHKAPSFGNPPRVFSYQELEHATDGFSDENFLAEGGYGSVHRGVLWDGQVVAIKQHKLASTQGDREFCSEVQILSCAQHRNVVMLIGYCIEDGRRLLVYEFICNKSLDSHLYGRERKPLEWAVRQKIAVGAARGLRYLHEECRVGCIVHRDMRPNNILLTHDFVPLVGDFGLARLQADGDSFEKTRVIGTFGYMAPEYAQTGQLCEKADVYSFGVVLVELVTGRKAVDIRRPKGEQCLTEWARPLLEEDGLSEHVDPCLMSCYSEREVSNMMRCALLCIQRDPESRPRMSLVLRMLEGDTVMG